MKKLFAMLTVLVMLLSAAAFAETVDLTGQWYLVEAMMGEMSINPAAMQMEMTLTLNEDGTVVASQAQGEEEPEVTDGTWELTDEGVVLTMGETSSVLAIGVDGRLAMDMDGEGYFFFGREPAEAEPLPQAVAAESEEAFLGVWNTSIIEMMGMTFPADESSVTTLTVEPGKLSITTANDDGAEEYTTEFADGVLILTPTDGESDTMTLQLNDDGSVAIPVMLGEEVFMTMYYEKAE